MATLTLGAAIWCSVKPVLKIYMIIITGFVLARKNVLTVETSRNLSDVVVSVVLPCLTFSKIVSNISYSDLKSIGVLAFVCVLILCFGGVFGLALNYVTRNPKIFYYGLISASIFPNIGDLPIAFVQGIPSIIFDSQMVDKGVAYVCIFSFTEQFVFFNLGFASMIGLDFKYEKQLNESDEEKRASSESITNGNGSSDGNNIDIGEDSNSEYLSAANLNTSSVRNYLGPLQTRRPRAFSNASSRLLRVSSKELRKLPSQKMNDMINEYSEAQPQQLSNFNKDHPQQSTANDDQLVVFDELGLIRTHTNISHQSSAKGHHHEKKEGENTSTETNNQDNDSILTHKSNRSKFNNVITKCKLGWLIFVLKNFKRPASIAIVVGLVISLIPWTKALFVSYHPQHNHLVNYPNAPDNQPPLHFLLDLTTYIGNAQVPFGLLLLGATLGRLEVKHMPQGVLLTSICLALVRLAILPIIGLLIMTQLKHKGTQWFQDDMAAFLSILGWGLPSMTTQIYITAFFTPVDGPHLQMDCMAVNMLIQYLFLIISFPILVTYALKVTLGY